MAKFTIFPFVTRTDETITPLGETEVQAGDHPIFKEEVPVEYQLGSNKTIRLEACTEEGDQIDKVNFTLNQLLGTEDNKLTLEFPEAKAMAILSYSLFDESKLSKVEILKDLGLQESTISMEMDQPEKKEEFELIATSNSKDTDYQEKFVKYLQGGLVIDGSLLIDYSGSSGFEEDKKCHHYHKKGSYNMYSMGVLFCSKILLDFEQTKVLTPLGFGATIKGQEEENAHYFRADDPNCKAVHTPKHLEKLYSSYLPKVKPTEKNLIAPILETDIIPMINQISKDYKQRYFIISIFTEGRIDDFEEVKDLVVKFCELPITFLFIGIGDADFSQVLSLDTDFLVDSTGKQAKRHCVRFVRLLDDEEGELEELLESFFDIIPEQIVKYFQGRSVEPREPQQDPSDKLKEEIIREEEADQEIEKNKGVKEEDK